MTLEVLFVRQVDLTDFVDFWSARYYDPREILYEGNIGRPLTPERIRELYVWKNGGKLSAAKAASVRSNYVERVLELRALPADTSPESFLEKWPDGGAIWRIFWLHCWQPERYRIFDQHVYRAAAHVSGWSSTEMPASDDARVRAYIDSYLPFWTSLGRPSRELDRALWAYGRFLKRWYGDLDLLKKAP